MHSRKSFYFLSEMRYIYIENFSVELHILYVLNMHANFHVNWMLFTIQSINSSFMHCFNLQKLEFKHMIDDMVYLIILKFCKLGE